MFRLIPLMLCFLSTAIAAPAPLLLISIDGLHPEYVIEAQRHGVKVPHLRSFVEQGSYARGVIGVVPTVTYPSHTTIMTGVAPAQHGIYSNTTFDPLQVNKDGWYWYAEDLKAATLWQAAKQAKLTTASVNWPVTVGDRNIDYLLPEYWRASTVDDLKAMRALSRPEGLMQELEAALGVFADGYVDTLESDRVRTRFSVELLRRYRPGFMATHLIALDGTEHREGPYGPDADRTLEAIDTMVGELLAVARAVNPDTIVVVVSDHGFIATHTAVNVKSAFVAAQLIRLKEPVSPDTVPVVDSWDAQVWSAAGSAAVMLRDPSDATTRAKVAQLLARLQADAKNGIARVLDKEETQATGGYPQADFLIEFAPGFYAGSALRGELLTTATSKGTHGYLPERSEMHAAFFIQGNGIARARDLGVIDMRRIAPTLATLLQLVWPDTAHRTLNVKGD